MTPHGSPIVWERHKPKMHTSPQPLKTAPKLDRGYRVRLVFAGGVGAWWRPLVVGAPCGGVVVCRAGLVVLAFLRGGVLPCLVALCVVLPSRAAVAWVAR